VQEEFYPVMQQLLSKGDRLDCILIETSGLALPKPLVQAFRWQEIRHRATVDSVITVVDSHALAMGQWVGDLDALEAQRQADASLDHETPLEELFEDQLACCDLVLLTKSDLVEQPTLDRIQAWLQSELRPGVKIIPCHQGEIAPEILFGFNAAVEDNLAARPGHHDQEEEHEHDDDIQSLHFLSDQSFEVSELVARLQQLVKTQEIYRIKGFVSVPHKPMRLVLQGVGDRFDSFYDRRWRADETPTTQIVVIGRSLDSEAIHQAIAAVAAQPVLP
jgi:cobalamin biosynthesis protein CobW